MKFFIKILLTLSLFEFGASAHANDHIKTVADFAHIIDFESNRVLMSKNADSPMKPASMAKIMTLYIVFSRIAEGSLTIEDEFLVSEKAWKMGGSRSFLDVGTRVSVEELINGIAVQSGNDAAVVVAEGISGSEEAFADEMEVDINGDDNSTLADDQNNEENQENASSDKPPVNLKDEGVKLWQFGKKVYQDFLNMASDDEIGDFTNITEGRDIKLTTVGPEVTGTPYNKTSVSPSLKTSPISNDEKVVKNVLENQPNPFDVFKKYTFDEVKAGLQEFLAPDEEEGAISSEPSVPFDGESKSNYSLDANKSKPKVDQFDDLFKDDDKDDLPF